MYQGGNPPSLVHLNGGAILCDPFGVSLQGGEIPPLVGRGVSPSENDSCTFRLLTGAVRTQSERSEPGEAKRPRLD